MTWVAILLQIFGPALAEIIKQILGEILPDLPLWKRFIARRKLEAMAKKHVLDARKVAATGVGPMEEFGRYRDQLKKEAGLA